MSTRIPAALRRLVAERADLLCEYCLIHSNDTFLGCQIEHVISEKHHGLTMDSNLAYACVFCNRFKGSDIGTLSPTGQLIRLFNLRVDRWCEHSRLVGLKIGNCLPSLNHPTGRHFSPSRARNNDTLQCELTEKSLIPLRDGKQLRKLSQRLRSAKRPSTFCE